MHASRQHGGVAEVTVAHLAHEEGIELGHHELDGALRRVYGAARLFLASTARRAGIVRAALVTRRSSRCGAALIIAGCGAASPP